MNHQKNKPLILSWNGSFFKPQFQRKTQVVGNLNLANNCPNNGVHFRIPKIKKQHKED